MKILHTSDWHLGKSLYDFSLLEDQTHFINWLLNLLTKERVDAVIIAGDVYDKPVPSASAIALYDSFLSSAVNELGIPVLAIAGNHDSPGRLQFGSRLYEKSGYHVLGTPSLLPHPVKLEDKWGPVYFLQIPYLHLAEARALFPQSGLRTFDDAYRLLMEQYTAEAELHADSRQVAIAHGFFGSLGTAEAELLTSDSEIGVGGMDLVDISHFRGWNYVALGHLHAPQRSGDNARYSGSPLKYSLSEAHQKKSVTLLELDQDGTVAWSVIQVPALRDVRSVQGTLEELLEPSYHQNQSFGDYVFAEIQGEECPYPMQKLRTLFPRLLGLRFSAMQQQAEGTLPHMQAEARIGKLTTEQLFRRFYSEAKKQKLPQEHAEMLREVLEELKEADAV